MSRRKDAVLHMGRYYVPTGRDTQWVSTLAEEFYRAGGTMCFNEDQTAIELRLPEGFKFSILFSARA